MSTEQQYRVIGKSGPGVEPRVGMVVWFLYQDGRRSREGAYALSPAQAEISMVNDAWDDGRYEILEAISPPQAEVAACADWCGLPYGDARVPSGLSHKSLVVAEHDTRKGKCLGGLNAYNCPHAAHCGNNEACLDRARSAKAQQETAQAAPAVSCRLPILRRSGAIAAYCNMRRGHNGVCEWKAAATAQPKGVKPPALTCIRSACKAPPVAGGELCAAHAGQVEAAKAKCCAWKNGVSACGRPSVGGRLCTKHEAELRASDAKPNPPPAETRLERWRREHRGYSHGTADPRLHDANVAAMMVGIDGPREPYVPPAPLAAWTPRDLDGDIPDAWEPGGARLGCTR